jgi:hypothetical protein
MPLLLPVQTSESVAVEHKITAGNQFAGVAPAGAQTSANYTTKYAASAAGGLFWFENIKPMVVHTVRANFGSSVAHTVSVVNVDAAGAEVVGENVQLLSATAQHLNLAPTRLTLFPGQAIKITTTGATLAMYALVAGQLEIKYGG